MLAEKTHNARAKLLADALDRATGAVLEHGRSPSRRCGEIDNRGGHFYLALYWARSCRPDRRSPSWPRRFARLAERLAAGEDAIVAELAAVQGEPVDLGGYYRPDPARAEAVMRPSATLAAALSVL